jgi:hypothetical protein
MTKKQLSNKLNYIADLLDINEPVTETQRFFLSKYIRKLAEINSKKPYIKITHITKV